MVYPLPVSVEFTEAIYKGDLVRKKALTIGIEQKSDALKKETPPA
jgi:hypothetical protein